MASPTRAHDDLFVSLLNAFGAETENFGEAGVFTPRSPRAPDAARGSSRHTAPRPST